MLAKDKNLTPSLALFNPSIRLIKDYFWQVMYLSFLPRLTFSAGLTAIVIGSEFATGSRLIIGSVVAAIGLIWWITTVTGFIYLQAKAAMHSEVSAMEAFRLSLPRIPAYIVTAGLSFLLIFLGLLLFIIPGLILLRGFFLAPYYAVEQKLSPVKALKKSLAMTKPVAGWIWGVIGIQLFVAIGALSFRDIPGIGPIIALAIGYLYIFAAALRYAEIEKNIPAITDKA